MPTQKTRASTRADAGQTAAKAPAGRAAGRTTRKRGSAARSVAAGDVAPARTASAVDRFAVSQAVVAANEHEIAAISDILKGEAPADREALMQTLLRQSRISPRARRANPDLELADDWRKGGYPYKNLLSRRSYEKQKYRLQVELLKLQAWVKDAGQKVIILFEGRDAAGKGARSAASWSTCTRAARAWWRWRSRANPSAASGTSSATCSTCRRAARS